jgi:hypothetical protein
VIVVPAKSFSAGSEDGGDHTRGGTEVAGHFAHVVQEGSRQRLTGGVGQHRTKPTRHGDGVRAISHRHSAKDFPFTFEE